MHIFNLVFRLSHAQSFKIQNNNTRKLLTCVFIVLQYPFCVYFLKLNRRNRLFFTINSHTLTIHLSKILIKTADKCNSASFFAFGYRNRTVNCVFIFEEFMLCVDSPWSASYFRIHLYCDF